MELSSTEEFLNEEFYDMLLAIKNSQDKTVSSKSPVFIEIPLGILPLEIQNVIQNMVKNNKNIIQNLVQKAIEFNKFNEFFKRYMFAWEYLKIHPQFYTYKKANRLQYIICEIYKIAFENNFIKIINIINESASQKHMKMHAFSYVFEMSFRFVEPKIFRILYEKASFKCMLCIHLKRADVKIPFKIIGEVNSSEEKIAPRLISQIISQIPQKDQQIIEYNFFYNFFNKYLLEWKNNKNNELLKYILSEIFKEACINNYIKIVQDLFGSDFDIIQKKINCPLLTSSFQGNHEIVKLLIDNGCDVNYASNGAFKFAIIKGHFEVIKLLLDAQSIDIVHDYKWSLRACIEHGYIDIFNLLIRYGKYKEYKINFNNLVKHAKFIYINLK